MFASKDLFFSKPSGGYQISRSVRTRSSASAYFNRTFTTPTDGKKYTFSIWVKRGALGTLKPLIGVYPSSGATDSTVQIFEFSAADILQFTGQTTMWRATTAVYRDPSAWYHIVLVYDSTQATAANRELLYVNGVQVTAFTTSNDVALNTVSPLNANGAVVHIGSEGVAGAAAGRYYDGYMTEINFIDGQALTPSSFGQTNSVTGVWQPIKYTGTYGTNGFYLNFSDNSNNTATTIGKDYSGNGNNWTPNNISVTAGVTYDSMVDSPTVGATSSNYAVLNPLTPVKSTLVDGNIRTTGGDRYSISTIGITSGKWYAEMTVTTVGTESSIGIATTIDSVGSLVGNNASSWGYVNSGNKYTNTTNTAYGASYTTGDVIGMAFDADAGTLTFYKNNTSQGTAFTGLTSGPYFFAMSGRTSGTANNCTLNFGQQGFVYTPPTGFVALNTQNLPTPTISNGANYMAATLYTGNGGTQSITNTVNGISFQPDLVWNKARSTATAHNLTDSVRGVQKSLFSNSTAAELASCELTAFNSNGYTLVRDAARAEQNENTVTYVGWQWKETPSAGFDIVACATNGSGIITATSHNLGVVPSMIILKALTGTDSWYVYHKNSTATPTQGTLQLNATSAVNTTNGSSGGVDKWTVSSSTFAAGNAAWTYQASTNNIAYLFAAVAGYSAFGSYTGNGSADGPFVFCGFRPRFILFKRTDSTSDWHMYDSSRDTYNQMQNYLAADISTAEQTVAFGDFLSNGFKLRSSGAGFNASGGTYIYACFAEVPFRYANAR